MDKYPVPPNVQALIDAVLDNRLSIAPDRLRRAFSIVYENGKCDGANEALNAVERRLAKGTKVVA